MRNNGASSAQQSAQKQSGKPETISVPGKGPHIPSPLPQTPTPSKTNGAVNGTTSAANAPQNKSAEDSQRQQSSLLGATLGYSLDTVSKVTGVAVPSAVSDMGYMAVGLVDGTAAVAAGALEQAASLAPLPKSCKYELASIIMIVCTQPSATKRFLGIPANVYVLTLKYASSCMSTVSVTGSKATQPAPTPTSTISPSEPQSSALTPQSQLQLQAQAQAQLAEEARQKWAPVLDRELTHTVYDAEGELLHLTVLVSGLC